MRCLYTYIIAVVISLTEETVMYPVVYSLMMDLKYEGTQK